MNSEFTQETFDNFLAKIYKVGKPTKQPVTVEQDEYGWFIARDGDGHMIMMGSADVLKAVKKMKP